MMLWILLTMGSPAREIPFDVVAEGKVSEFQEKTFQVIKDPALWDTVWTKVSRGKLPPPERPDVSFQDSMLILVASGSRGVMNRSIRVVKVIEKGQALVVQVAICEPPEGGITLPAFSQPYQIVKIPRIEGEVAFEEVPCSEEKP